MIARVSEPPERLGPASAGVELGDDELERVVGGLRRALVPVVSVAPGGGWGLRAAPVLDRPPWVEAVP